MSTPNSGGAQDLNQDELILHHHAAMVKKDLDAYHTRSRSQADWVDIFKTHLARIILPIRSYKPSSDSSTVEQIGKHILRRQQQKVKPRTSRSSVIIEPHRDNQ